MRAAPATWSAESRTCTWPSWSQRSASKELCVSLEDLFLTPDTASRWQDLWRCLPPRSTPRWWRASTTEKTAPRTTSVGSFKMLNWSKISHECLTQQIIKKKAAKCNDSLRTKWRLKTWLNLWKLRILIVAKTQEKAYYIWNKTK